MSEIKIGEYVRTESGNIGKVLDITDVTMQKRKKYLIKWNISKAYYITAIRIIKYSPNIIDLIEEGDYVNGKEITSVSKYQDKKVVCYTEETYGGISYHIFNKDIKSIVTKEMMESVEYRID